MDQLNAARRVVLLVGGVLGAAACSRAAKEGPPPAESLEIASAAPRAFGALAGGTESAPSNLNAPGVPDPEPPAEDLKDDDEDGGVPLGRDAGGRSPEDLPL